MIGSSTQVKNVNKDALNKGENKMRYKNNKSGFTLLEIIIVIIIVGVLASLALPRFFQTIEFSRSSEALNALGVLKRSADRCAMMAGAAVGTTPVYTNCETFAEIGIEDPTGAAGSSFTYGTGGTYAAGPPETWVTYAERNGTGDRITLSVDITNSTVTRGGTGAFSGIQ